MLISKLEKNKNMKPEERANIMKTLKELGEKISQLKDELKTSSAVSTPSKVKTKTEVSVCLFYSTWGYRTSVTCLALRKYSGTPRWLIVSWGDNYSNKF